jgi:hypothetical protein
MNKRSIDGIRRAIGTVVIMMDDRCGDGGFRLAGGSRAVDILLSMRSFKLSSCPRYAFTTLHMLSYVVVYSHQSCTSGKLAVVRGSSSLKCGLMVRPRSMYVFI